MNEKLLKINGGKIDQNCEKKNLKNQWRKNQPKLWKMVPKKKNAKNRGKKLNVVENMYV